MTNPSHLVFDIETVPQPAQSLSSTQKDRIANLLSKNDYWKEDLKKEMALNPWFGKIVCIGLYYPEQNKTKAFCDVNESKVIQDFWNEISSFSGTFVSYNGLMFDVPYIKVRSMVNGALPTNKNFLDSKRYQTYPHFDVAQHIADWENRLRASLDVVCDGLGIESPKHGEVVAANVAEYYELGKLDLIADYCIKDLKATFDVYTKVRRFRV